MKQDKTKWFIYRPLRNVKSHERLFNDPHKIKLSPNAKEFQKYLVNQIERAQDNHSIDESAQEIRPTNLTENDYASAIDVTSNNNLNKANSANQLDTSLYVTHLQDDLTRRLAIKQEQIYELQDKLRTIEGIHQEKISLLQELNKSLRKQVQHYETRLSTIPIKKSSKLNSPTRQQMSSPQSLRGSKSNRRASPESFVKQEQKWSVPPKITTREEEVQTEIFTNPLQEQLDHAMMKIQALEIAKIQLIDMFSNQADSKQSQRGEQRQSPPKTIRPKTARTLLESEIENLGRDLRLKPEGSHLDQIRKIGTVVQDLKKQLANEQRKLKNQKLKQTPPKGEKVEVMEDQNTQQQQNILHNRIKELEEQNSRLSKDINSVIVNKIKHQEERVLLLESEKQELINQIEQANKISHQNQRDWDKLLIDIQINHKQQLKKLEEVKQDEMKDLNLEKQDLINLNKIHKQEIIQVNSILSDTQRYCKKLEFTANQLETEVKVQKRHIQDLVDQLDSANSTKNELQIQIEQHQQTIQSFQTLVKRKQSSLNNSPVRGDINQQSELESLKRQLLDLEEQIKELKKQLENAKILSRKSLDEKNNDLKLAQQKYNKLQTEFENVMESFQQDQSPKIQNNLDEQQIQQEIQKIKQENQIIQEEYELKIQSLKAQLASQDNQIVLLKEQIKQLGSFRDQCIQLKEQIQIQNNQVQHLTEENNRLQQIVANHSNSEKTKQENQELQKKINLLQEELEDIKEQQDDSPTSLQSVQSTDNKEKRTSLISFQTAIRRASVMDERRIIDQLREDLLDQNKIIRTQIMQLQAHENFQKELEAKIEGLNNTDANQWYNKYCEIQELYSSLSLQFQQIEQVCEEQSNQLEQIQQQGTPNKRPTIMASNQVEELKSQLNQYEAYLQGREEHIINLENYIQQITEQYQELERVYNDALNEITHHKEVQNQQSLIIEELQNGSHS